MDKVILEPMQGYENYKKKLRHEIDYVTQKIADMKLNESYLDYDSPEERINNVWRKKGFWKIIPPWMYAVRKDGYLKGRYDIPTNIHLNEHWIDFYKNESLIKEESELLNDKHLKKTLEKKELDLRRKITAFKDMRWGFYDRIRNKIMEHIDRDTDEVLVYESDESYFLQDLIYDYEIIFYGVQFGSLAVIDKDLSWFLSKGEKNKYRNELERLLNASKEHYLLQVAIKNYRSHSTESNWDYAKPLVKEILNDIDGISDLSHESVREIFSKHCESFDSIDHKKYVKHTTGKLNKTWVGEAIAQICQKTIQEIESISGDTIKRKISSDTYPNDDLKSKYWD